MVRTWMLDTNTVSYIVRGISSAARDRLDGLKINEVGCISVVTEAEIRYGLARKPPSPAFRTVLNDFLAKIKSCPGAATKRRPTGPFASNWNVPARPLAPSIC